jgi:tight adherence protein C
MLLALIASGCSATVFTVVIVLIGNRSDITRRIAEIENAATPHVNRQQPIIVKKLLSGVDKSAISAKLAEAGWYRTSVMTFVLSRFTCFAATAIVAIAFLFLTQQASAVYVVFAIGVAALGLALPSFALDDAIKKRKVAIGNRLPDFLDMLSTTVEAGIALNAALATAAASLTGPLSEEIGMVLSDIRLGRNRADAFSAMAARAHQVDLSSLVMAIVQTERLGGNIGHVLDELAEEARARRLQRAEEIAASLPVKMVLPMAFFMLPALFTMIFSPVVAQLVGGK